MKCVCVTTASVFVSRSNRKCEHVWLVLIGIIRIYVGRWNAMQAILVLAMNLPGTINFPCTSLYTASFLLANSLVASICKLWVDVPDFWSVSKFSYTGGMRWKINALFCWQCTFPESTFSCTWLWTQVFPSCQQLGCQIFWFLHSQTAKREIWVDMPH